MGGTGVSGSPSEKAVGFDPGGLSHFQGKSGHCLFPKPGSKPAPGSAWRVIPNPAD
jgi:hypothetical protein